MAVTIDTTGNAAPMKTDALGLEMPRREVKPAPDRWRNSLGKYRIWRSELCNKCGTCEKVCPRGVHERPEGYVDFVRGNDWRCTAAKCKENGTYCVDKCPQKALRIEETPLYKSLGDFRWTADLILSTWYMAETGQVPDGELDYHHGNSGGGFDKIRFRFPEDGPRTNPDEINTAIELNRRDDDGRPRIRIDLPVYGGGMSFGSVSPHTILSKARAAMAWNIFSCTGEGGYIERLLPYKDNMITQVATGLFGVREETIRHAPIVEFKYAQGAKPGLGGHLLGDKNTPAVAAMREAVPGTPLFSPFPFHSVYSIEDHKKHIDWIKHVNPRALVSAKVSTPVDVDMVAVGSYFAGANIVHLDGSYGGTGAAPEIAKKNIAMPIEYAIPKVSRFLEAEGIRDKITLIASGGIRTAYDAAKAIALGADGVVIGTTEMVALGCIRCGKCESGKGCARGIATTDPVTMEKMTTEWGTQRLINLLHAWRLQLVDILSRFGMKDVAELRGRTDLLMHLDYE
ncbi:MAG: glutamate synthase-related protein [Armatimonadetes bacterium]|nr:glutamate synthase-related protein [Armatimonadota bacterium]